MGKEERTFLVSVSRRKHTHYRDDTSCEFLSSKDFKIFSNKVGERVGEVLVSRRLYKSLPTQTRVCGTSVRTPSPVSSAPSPQGSGDGETTGKCRWNCPGYYQYTSTSTGLELYTEGGGESSRGIFLQGSHDTIVGPPRETPGFLLPHPHTCPNTSPDDPTGPLWWDIFNKDRGQET